MHLSTEHIVAQENSGNSLTILLHQCLLQFLILKMGLREVGDSTEKLMQIFLRVPVMCPTQSLRSPDGTQEMSR